MRDPATVIACGEANGQQAVQYVRDGHGLRIGNRKVLGAGALITIVLAVTAAAVFISHAGQGRSVTGKVFSGGHYGFSDPVAIAVSGAELWVVNEDGNSVTELNASNGHWVQTLSGASYGFNRPDAIVADGTRLWVANGGGLGSVTELSAEDGRLIQTISGGRYGFNYPQAITADATHVWVANNSGGANDDGSVTELDARDGRWVQTLSGSGYGFMHPVAIAVGGGHVWVGNYYGSYGGNSVTELSVADGRFVQAVAGGGPGFDDAAGIVYSGRAYMGWRLLPGFCDRTRRHRRSSSSEYLEEGSRSMDHRGQRRTCLGRKSQQSRRPTGHRLDHRAERG